MDPIKGILRNSEEVIYVFSIQQAPGRLRQKEDFSSCILCVVHNKSVLHEQA